ncbi:MAG: c-type cytochrome [Thermoguttaceae bacterium]|nr:c-type cytochrome [Thermoguttaceae bacterium]
MLSQRLPHPGSAARGKLLRKKERTLLLIAAAIGLILLILFGPNSASQYAQWRARHALYHGYVTGALQWLAWASKVAPSDGRIDLLRAKVFRRLNDVVRFAEALREAERKGLAPEEVSRVRRLALIQAGQLPPGPENDVGFLIQHGYDPAEVAEAFIYGALVRGDYKAAETVIESWRSDFPHDVNPEYLSGIVFLRLGDYASAENCLRDVIRREPRHELAWLALTDLFIQHERWDEVETCCRTWYQQLPNSDLAASRLARAWRHRGDLVAARQLLVDTRRRFSDSEVILRELAEVDLDLGNFKSVQDWYVRFGGKLPADRELLHLLGLAASLTRRAYEALKLMEESERVFSLSCRIREQQSRLQLTPLGLDNATQLEQLRQEMVASSGTTLERVVRSIDLGIGTGVESLYRRYCAACHGETGGADGPASRFLFPRARNLRSDLFRIVSNENMVPDEADVFRVIRNGMPGTAMRAFPELSDTEVQELAAFVLSLRRKGFREKLAREIKQQEEEVTEEELDQLVDLNTRPATKVVVAEKIAADAGGEAQGLKNYHLFGCANCHGPEGTGPCDLALWDDQGYPNPPRDLQREPFKGGSSFEELFLRIYLGMPGTAHPGCPSASVRELASIIHYCQSLQTKKLLITTNYERWLQAWDRAWLPAYENR